TPTPPDLPWCTKAKLGGLLGDGEFASMEGWRAWSGNAQLSLVNVAKGCRDPAADQRNLYVAVWSDSGASLLVDEMNLQEAQSAPPSVPPAPKRIAYDFES
ncbi:carbohydrate-binding protein, partial [Escherichia coli]